LAPLGQLVGRPPLPPGRLLQSNGDHGFLPLGRHSILEGRLAPAQLLHGRFPALLVELLEAIETIPAVAHDLAGLRDVASLFG